LKRFFIELAWQPSRCVILQNDYPAYEQRSQPPNPQNQTAASSGTAPDH
jgi:hypothetical protein